MVPLSDEVALEDEVRNSGRGLGEPPHVASRRFGDGNTIARRTAVPKPCGRLNLAVSSTQLQRLRCSQEPGGRYSSEGAEEVALPRDPFLRDDAEHDAAV